MFRYGFQIIFFCYLPIIAVVPEVVSNFLFLKITITTVVN